jgi:hypothetical protein
MRYRKIFLIIVDSAWCPPGLASQRIELQLHIAIKMSSPKTKPAQAL